MSQVSFNRIRPPLEQFTAPVLQFDPAAEIEQLRKEEPWLKSGHNAKTLVKHSDFRIVLTLIKAGTRLKEHKASGSISIQALTGHLRLHMPDQTVELPAGHLLALDQAFPHDIEALEESAFLLTISWPKGEVKKVDHADQRLEFKIPQPLKVEHEELHAELARATKLEGEIGEAARKVAELLHPHFVNEEEYALPPLGILSFLAEGKVTPEMKTVLAMTDKLKAEIHHMVEEHRTIVAALKDLVDVATKEGKDEYARFAEKLMLHAQTEEEVLYPAAMLIGEYLKLKFAK